MQDTTLTQTSAQARTVRYFCMQAKLFCSWSCTAQCGNACIKTRTHRKCRGVIVQQRWVRTDVNRSNPLVQFQLVKGRGYARLACHRRSVRSCNIARPSVPFEVDFGKNGPQLRRNLDPLSPLGSNFGPIWLLFEVHILSTRRTLLPQYEIEKKMNFH